MHLLSAAFIRLLNELHFWCKASLIRLFSPVRSTQKMRQTRALVKCIDIGSAILLEKFADLLSLLDIVESSQTEVYGLEGREAVSIDALKGRAKT